MFISTKGRYALRVMIDLAEHSGGEYIPMKDVAARQDISLKYLEKILPVLTKNGMIDSVHGKGGGCRLSREPDAYVVGDILRLAEGDLSPVSCLAESAAACERAAECRTLPMWREFDRVVNEFFDSYTLADLISTPQADNYVI